MNTLSDQADQGTRGCAQVGWELCLVRVWDGGALTEQGPGQDPKQHRSGLQALCQRDVERRELDLHGSTRRTPSAGSVVRVPTRRRRLQWAGKELIRPGAGDEGGCPGLRRGAGDHCALREAGPWALMGEVSLPPAQSLGPGSPPVFDHCSSDPPPNAQLKHPP